MANITKLGSRLQKSKIMFDRCKMTHSRYLQFCKVFPIIILLVWISLARPTRKELCLSEHREQEQPRSAGVSNDPNNSKLQILGQR